MKGRNPFEHVVRLNCREGKDNQAPGLLQSTFPPKTQKGGGVFYYYGSFLPEACDVVVAQQQTTD